MAQAIVCDRSWFHFFCVEINTFSIQLIVINIGWQSGKTNKAENQDYYRYETSLGVGFDHNLCVKGTGIALHDCGAYFSTNKDHPDCIEPNKKPFHTLIPSIITKKTVNGHELETSFSATGLFVQSQCQVQYVLSVKHSTSNLQRILDFPRICIKSSEEVKLDLNNSEDSDDYVLLLEDAVSKKTVDGLKSKGHRCRVWLHSITYAFGCGSIIFSRIDISTGKKVLSAGCDGRTDCHAPGY